MGLSGRDSNTDLSSGFLVRFLERQIGYQSGNDLFRFDELISKTARISRLGIVKK